MLKKEDLHAEVHDFMDKNCTYLKKNTTEYTMAFWQHVVSILKSKDSMEDIANLLVNGLGCVVPVIMDIEGEATNGQAFITMGTPAMLKKKSMLRYMCPGMSNRFHGSQKNNMHSVPYDTNLLVSPTHCFVIDAKASGQTTKISNDKDGIYAGRMIRIGNERRIIRRVYEQRRCNKPDDQQKLVVSLSDMISGSVTALTNIINSCSFMQPHVELGKLRTSTSSVNCEAVRA
jgi:hypothetical protein